MGNSTIPLFHPKIPAQPSKPLHLNGQPLQIIDLISLEELSQESLSSLSPSTLLATVLHTWNPTSLLAFLDHSTWFSFTWTLTLPNSTTLEIGRILSQITFGSLDASGNWTLMLTYNLSSTGIWHPNPRESMLDDQDITDLDEIERLAHSFAAELVLQKRWETGKGLKHSFFIEFAATADNIWSDGIAMNPHWLYRALDLGRCTTCDVEGGEGLELRRCGKCGTAAYCSDRCQRRDWAVHKGVCGMGLEERGRALHLTKDGGLVKWARGNGDGEGESVDD
ncbi:hypothetical protein DOTSEDRAFT_176070 [Dothistroma septosporum NZE10]|uniref:MYND-type domain-containing protein n=1 Tax=Dothistroma septosporum (strain NZE10 / CBS 128990) TaxID=675120 RepID=N1PJM6_DOTSN|nr:hypothetical protein DOTSEDRAFT_176070 [Dothistroma septosporum NZE10]